MAPQPFLVFHLGLRSYGIPFARIAEIFTLDRIVPVLHAPTYDRGHIVLNRRTIPLVDLRSMVGAPRKITADTRLIVTWIDHVSRLDIPLGLLVDATDQVETYDPRQIMPCPDYGPSVDTKFILGTIETPRGPRLLFDVDNLMPAPTPYPHFLAETARLLSFETSPLRNGYNGPIGAR